MAILSPSTLGLPPHLHSWTQSPEGCCTLVLLLDQFPRNAFRGTAATQLRILVLSCFPFCSVSWVAWFTHDFLISLPGPWDKIFDRYIYIYIYMVTPPPWSTYKHFIWELPVFYAHFFLPEKWHSHVSISFTYYVSCRPRHTHTCNFVFVYFFVISWGFGQKPKNIEKTKKTKKNKIARPM